MRRDRLVLKGVRARGRHGVLAREREEGQTFAVDVAICLDTREAAAGDDLTATVDYGALARRIVDIIEGDPVSLIETLAARLAEACLAEPRAEEVEVTVHKPEAPVGVPFDDVSVTIVRSRT